MNIKLTLACAAGALLATWAIAQDATGFRGEDEGDWYHPIEHESWEYWGAQPAVIDTVLAKIEQSQGPRRIADMPDTQIAYGAGNWVFEFDAAGDEAIQVAQSASTDAAAFAGFKAALAYYHIASAPHTNDPQARAALHKSGEAYAAAAAFLPGTFSTVEIPFDGATFTTHLHIPPGEGPFPVLVFSNGSDQSKETALNYYQTHLLPRGIAFLALDMPGMGDSAAYDLQDHVSDKLHIAAVEYLRSRADIATQNVFIQGNSFGGHAAARAFLTRTDLDLGGVAYVCGPLNGAFLAPPQAYEQLPVFTMDGVKTRLGLSVDATSAQLSDAAQGMALGDIAQVSDARITTPLLAINNNADPVAPVEEMNALLLARAENGTAAVFDIAGHCPPHALREPIIAAWIMDNLR